MLRRYLVELGDSLHLLVDGSPSFCQRFPDYPQDQRMIQ